MIREKRKTRVEQSVQEPGQEGLHVRDAIEKRQEIEMDLDSRQAKLRSWFESKMPHARGISLSPLNKPDTGLSSDTFVFDLQWQEAGERRDEKLVVRWRPTDFEHLPKYDMKEQFLIIERLGKTSVPVPKARWLEEDESVIGTAFYIMDHVEGWVPMENPSYHVEGPVCEGTPGYRSNVWWEAVDILVKVHTLDWKAAGFAFLGVPTGGTRSIDDYVDYGERMLRMNEGEPDPILETTLDWLRKNRFVPRHLSLCWGDARLGNLIYRGDRIAAVLDWEGARLSDPESDLAWFLNVDWFLSAGYTASPAPRLQGLPGREETIEYYEKATNRKVENLFYHDVFACWRLLIAATRLRTILQAKGYFPDVDVTKPFSERLRSLLKA